MAPRILEHLGLPLEVERQVAYWFEPLNGLKPFLPDRPPHLHLGADEGGVFYGFPAQNVYNLAKFASFRVVTTHVTEPFLPGSHLRLLT